MEFYTILIKYVDRHKNNTLRKFVDKTEEIINVLKTPKE